MDHIKFGQSTRIFILNKLEKDAKQESSEEEVEKSFFLKDPKTALELFFDEQDEELKINTLYLKDEKRYSTVIKLDMIHKKITDFGKTKTEAETKCILKCCHMLFDMDLLNKSEAVKLNEQKERLKKYLENDESSASENDSNNSNEVLSYEKILELLEKLKDELKSTNKKLDSLKNIITDTNNEDSDDLDNFMKNIETGLNNEQLTKNENRKSELEKETARLETLLTLCKPDINKGLQKNKSEKTKVENEPPHKNKREIDHLEANNLPKNKIKSTKPMTKEEYIEKGILNSKIEHEDVIDCTNDQKIKENENKLNQKYGY